MQALAVAAAKATTRRWRIHPGLPFQKTSLPAKQPAMRTDATPMKKAMAITMTMHMHMRQPIWIRRWSLPPGNGCAFPIWIA
jgi:hypothetical protein